MGKSMVSCRFSQQNQSIDGFQGAHFAGLPLCSTHLDGTRGHHRHLQGLIHYQKTGRKSTTKNSKEKTSKWHITKNLICTNDTWLVVWNMNSIFPIQLGISSSQLTKSIIFQKGQGSTTNQIRLFPCFPIENLSVFRQDVMHLASELKLPALKECLGDFWNGDRA